MPAPIPPPRESGTTTSTPIPLFWVRYGDPSRPSLIVLHGGPGADHRYLLPQMLHLAERYDLVLYDQRGSGRSKADNNAPITWQDHVADLASIADELSLGAPSLVGYSWGGMLSMLYAISALDNRSLVPPARLALISPAPINRQYRGEFEANLRQRGATAELTAAREALAQSGLRESDPDAYRQRLFELGVSGYFYDTAQAHDLTPFRVVGRVQQSTWESLGDYDLEQGLGRLTVPAHIVHGRDDPIPAASSMDAANALGCSLTLIDQCGHVPYVEQPAALWTALDPFLAATDVVAAPMWQDTSR